VKGRPRYRTICISLWNDRKYRSLSRDAKLLFVYLLTTPAGLSIPGVVIGGPASLAEGIGFDAEALNAALSELVANGMVKADTGARLIWMPKAMVHRKLEGANQMVGAANYWADVPECDLKHEVWLALKEQAGECGESLPRDFIALFPEPYLPPSDRGCSRGSGTQEQYQEQEKEKEQEQKVVPTSPAPKAKRKSSSSKAVKPNPDHGQFVEAFSKLFAASNEGAKPTWGGKQGKQVKDLLKDHGIETCIQRAQNMFEAPPKFPPPPYDLGTLVGHFDKFAKPHKSNDIRHGHVAINGTEAYAGGDVDI